MGSIVKPQATQWKSNDENKPRTIEEESKIRTIEIDTILDRYPSPSLNLKNKSRNLVTIDDSDSDEAKPIPKVTTQKQALTTGTSSTYEDIQPHKTLFNHINSNNFMRRSQQQLPYKRSSSEGLQTPCPRTAYNFIDNIESIGSQSTSLIFNHSPMNLQHISEVDGNHEAGIDKGGVQKRITKLELPSNSSVCHIDDLEEEEETNNIQKVSNLESPGIENIQLSNANNEKQTIQHIDDIDGLDDHRHVFFGKLGNFVQLKTNLHSAITSLVDDAQEKGNTAQIQTPKPWAAAARYNRYRFKSQASQAPQASATTKVTHRNMVRPNLQGGIKPVNKLGNSQNAAPPSQTRGPERFNLHGDRPNKKQRIEQASLNNGTLGGPNQCEEQGQDQRPVRRNSTQSQYNNSSYQESGSPGRDKSLRGYNGLAHVDEYQAVNELVNPKKHRKVNQRSAGSQDYSHGRGGFGVEQASNAKRIPINPSLEDVEDPIDDPADEDELQVSQPIIGTTPRVVIPVNGNARPIPPSSARGSQTSPDFGSTQTSKQMPPRSIQKRSVLGELQIEDGSEDELSQYNAPDLSHGKQVNNSRGGMEPNNNACEEGSDYESSPDTRADITPTICNRGTGGEKLEKQRNVTRYGIQSLFSQSRYWHQPTTSKKWCIILDAEHGDVTLLNEALKPVPGFLIKAISILKLKLGRDSCKLIIRKSGETTGAMQGSFIFIEFYSIKWAQHFVDSLLPFLKNCDPDWLEQSDIDKTFHTTRTTLEKRTSDQAANKRSRAESQPEDIQLYEAKQRRRDAQHPNSPENDNQQSYSDDRPLKKKRKIRERMQGPHTPQNINGTSDTIEAADFYSGTSKSNGTRLSLRSADRSRSYKPASRERTPSPERWTESNRGWEKDWVKSVVYPKTGKKTATVDKQDIYRLDNGEFLNDNLIMFYLLWLEQQHSELASRVYVHNTFFYASLTKTVKGKKGINYEAVERWTAKVDLLSYDYIIVPVNENTHWYVAIISNAPKLLNPETNEQSQTADKDAKIQLDRGIESHDASKPATPSKSPRSTPMRSVNDTEDNAVGSSFAELSLENIEDNTETPLDTEPVGDLPPSNHGLSIISSDVDSASGKSSTNVVDLAQSSSPLTKPNPAAKGKKPPATRVYDPKQPRIITFDSLALRHSQTCANLRDYLVAEIKSKKGISITPPKTLGKAAKTQAKDDETGRYLGKGLPEQGNYCDCGVYLLSYMEEFFERPDGFIEDIMRDKYEVNGNRNDTPVFRTKIRDILFELQEDQKRDAHAAKKAKNVKKPAAKPLVVNDMPDTQTSTPHISTGARPQPVSGTSRAIELDHGNTLIEAAKSAPKSLPSTKRKEVMGISDSQDDVQEQRGKESASRLANDAEDSLIEETSGISGHDREPRQTAPPAVNPGLSKPPIHMEIRDSFEDEESTQETLDHQPVVQQQPKRKNSIIVVDEDDHIGQDSRDNKTWFGNAVSAVGGAVGKILQKSNSQTASKSDGLGPRITSEELRQDDIEALKSPLHSVDTHSGIKSPRRRGIDAKPMPLAQDLRSISPESDKSKVPKQEKPSPKHVVDLSNDIKNKKKNRDRVDLTGDGPDVMLLDQDESFPDVQEIPPSPPAAVSRRRPSVMAPFARKDVGLRREEENSSLGRFRHPGVETFVNRQPLARDSAEQKMIAQSKGDIL